jgi:hypothetical protein
MVSQTSFYCFHFYNYLRQYLTFMVLTKKKYEGYCSLFNSTLLNKGTIALWRQQEHVVEFELLILNWTIQNLTKPKVSTGIVTQLVPIWHSNVFQYCLSDRPNKPCYVLEFHGVTLMLDCALDSSTVLNFMPIPLVQSAKLCQLPRYLPKDGNNDHNVDGVSASIQIIEHEDIQRHRTQCNTLFNFVTQCRDLAKSECRLNSILNDTREMVV